MKKNDGTSALVPVERIERHIHILRGHKVMLDTDLAELYGVTPGRLNEQVKRNAARFPVDFMFRLTAEEVDALRRQIGTSILKSQFAISSSAHGGRRSAPNAFTEQGVAMLSGVLRSKRAVEVNVQIMRAFVKLRLLLASNAQLARKLAELENKYDGQFKVVFEAIRELMTPPPAKKRRIGF